MATNITVPTGIQKYMDNFHIEDVSNIHIPSAQTSTESSHRPEEGYFSGLDSEEIVFLEELDPDLKEQYDEMTNSQINKENLQKDLEDSIAKIEELQKTYNKKSSSADNWFFNLFRSGETKEALQEEKTS